MSTSNFHHNLALVCICISLFGGCKSPIHNVTATRTAQVKSIEATVEAMTTRPEPFARIIEPQYVSGERQSSSTQVQIEYKHVAPDQFLWIVLRVPKVKPEWLIYPQLQDGIPQLQGDGYYETTVGLGGDGDSNEPFNIVVLLLDEESNRVFTEYSESCIKTSNCGGLPLPDHGVRILDFNTVIRE